jgi:glycogen debranching enzyme
LRIADATAVLTPFTGTYFFADPIDGSAVFTSYGTGRRYRITSIAGELGVEGAEALGSHARAVTASGARGWEVVIEEFEAARAPYAVRQSFDSVVAASASQFGEYLEAVADWRTGLSPAAALAAYVMWSATVAPRGFLQRESMLMSKHWMDKVWSWDHCFNALALAPADITLAVDQLLVPFDHQDAAGALPDSVTHSEVLYNFVKPPIHGWALRELRAIAEVPRDTLVEVYERLARWTTFWLASRRAPGHALPHYQHGNDSGWDNSTAFDLDRVLEAPDLAAFLLVQLEVLADLADELSIDADWRAAQAELRAALLAELWDGERFVATGALSATRSATTSLLLLLLIVAADQLPAEVVERLGAMIAEHLTPHGLATELPSSPQYEADGYWRGPIWAPSTVLIENGLRRGGLTALADEVSLRFRALCETSGFAENFDALTGEGLRDRAYTWTASSYLYLARQAEARSTEKETP